MSLYSDQGTQPSGLHFMDKGHYPRENTAHLSVSMNAKLRDEGWWIKNVFSAASSQKSIVKKGRKKKSICGN